MTKKPTQNFTYWLKVIVIGVAFGFALQFVRAWTEPTSSPPNGNVGAPINTGASVQEKGDATHNGDICVWSGGVKKCLSTGSGIPGPQGPAGPSGYFACDEVWASDSGCDWVLIHDCYHH